MIEKSFQFCGATSSYDTIRLGNKWLWVLFNLFALFVRCKPRAVTSSHVGVSIDTDKFPIFKDRRQIFNSVDRETSGNDSEVSE